MTVEDIVIPVRCPVLGVKLKTNKGVIGDNSPTLDKLIPRLGYVPGNIIVVSALANRIKSDATPHQLRQVADFYLALYQE